MKSSRFFSRRRARSADIGFSSNQLAANCSEGFLSYHDFSSVVTQAGILRRKPNPFALQDSKSLSQSVSILLAVRCAISVSSVPLWRMYSRRDSPQKRIAQRWHRECPTRHCRLSSGLFSQRGFARLTVLVQSDYSRTPNFLLWKFLNEFASAPLPNLNI